MTVADNPAHYHAIDRITTRWASYVEAVRQLAHVTPDQLAKDQRNEKEREVHVTDTPHSEKGQGQRATSGH